MTLGVPLFLFVVQLVLVVLFLLVFVAELVVVIQVVEVVVQLVFVDLILVQVLDFVVRQTAEVLVPDSLSLLHGQPRVNPSCRARERSGASRTPGTRIGCLERTRDALHSWKSTGSIRMRPPPSITNRPPYPRATGRVRARPGAIRQGRKGAA